MYENSELRRFLSHSPEIGPNCSTLVNYFEANGAEPCDPEANPAEWMLAGEYSTTRCRSHITLN